MYDSRLDNITSLEFSAVARKARNDGQNLISLGLGEPHWDPPIEITNHLSQIIKDSSFGYSSPYGETSLRESILSDLNNKYQLKFNLSNVMITNGAKGALTLALSSILEAGDNVLVVEPCYVSYIPQIFLAAPNTSPISFKLDSNFDFDFVQLKKVLLDKKPKCILISSPCNPTGISLSADELSNLVSLARLVDCYLIVDEIYSDLSLESNVNSRFTTSLSLFNTYNKLIYINGFSKTFAMTSWRIGFLIANNFVINRSLKLLQHQITCIPSFLQKSASKFLHVHPSWVHDKCLSLRKNLNLFSQVIEDHSLCDIISFRRPSHGMFVFPHVDLPNFDSDKFSSNLLKSKSVAVAPGKIFGSSWNNYIRISLASPCDVFSEGIHKLIYFIKESP
ncbi:pyridoxal phosphate-dependent aminotransferase [Synechococcus sp. UW140]|uniref:pyridoxal phosphate-dependent aminotransferase n=1 Tax=Synechococcus sp. UW140 TaxID=368503 RepID=UPI000E0EA6A1|nr:pyridoxal phosphate-dependent aminotransferase [Synechococcus sp. UW140]